MEDENDEDRPVGDEGDTLTAKIEPVRDCQPVRSRTSLEPVSGCQTDQASMEMKAKTQTDCLTEPGDTTTNSSKTHKVTRCHTRNWPVARYVKFPNYSPNMQRLTLTTPGIKLIETMDQAEQTRGIRAEHQCSAGETRQVAKKEEQEGLPGGCLDRAEPESSPPDDHSSSLNPDTQPITRCHTRKWPVARYDICPIRNVDNQIVTSIIRPGDGCQAVCEDMDQAEQVDKTRPLGMDRVDVEHRPGQAEQARDEQLSSIANLEDAGPNLPVELVKHQS